MGVITFNGVTSTSKDIIVQFIPSYEFGQKEYEQQHIPGRNGDLIIDRGAYQNVNRKYYLASVIGSSSSFSITAKKYLDWLSTVKGYKKLTDTYEPDYYRLAAYVSGGEVNNYYNKATALEIEFICKPQRFLTSGEDYVTLSATHTLTNPTQYASKPIIRITGNNPTGTITFTNGSNVVTLTISSNSTTHTDLYIDSDTMNCYYEDNTSANNYVSSNTSEFPELLSGNTVVTRNLSNTSSVKLKPNWWTL